MRGSVSKLDHVKALMALQKELDTERDRRYAEVNVEKEKALKIKETADLAALQLAREIQTYKDEKANELREQINRERVYYASKEDVANVSDKLEAMVKPVIEYVQSQQGRSGGRTDWTRNMTTVIGLGLTAVTILVGIWLARN